ncbi:MAG: MMPL family transporter, partial [Oscillospiraceae bacterium]|nr:MMPL family transporter [Oscillospiraceae bacterium]
YRVPCIVASIALIFYTALMVVVMSIFEVNLSLPGIAGIVLSIGMAVDANVIIFERIKEELAVGKTLRAAIDSGFKRAFTAILDSNVTTLIAAVVLYFFGMGTIVGFATTLGIGVIISMFTVLVVSRFMLYRLADMNIKSLKAYGVKGGKQE